MAQLRRFERYMFKSARRSIRSANNMQPIPQKLKNALPSSIYTTDKSVSSSIIQIKEQLTCHSGHPAARSQMLVYICYLLGIKTLV